MWYEQNQTFVPFYLACWVFWEIVDHTACALMTTPPEGTHPTNHKWTGLVYNKLVELGWLADIKI